VHDVEGLGILYTNIDQFLNKRDDLELAIAGNEPDIILITEILPKAHCNTLTSSRLSLNGHSFVLNFDPDGTPRPLFVVLVFMFLKSCLFVRST